MRESESVRVGAYIRETVIPKGMTVKTAAERLGVGRPALSNLLNGRAALSPEMALRLEQAFGADRRQLLDLQARWDREARRASEKEIAVRAYVPSFLTIKARQIEDWASTLDARQHLAVLLRKLVHSTGRELRDVDFPGYDNSQRKGWDGRVEADAATPWVPEGRSGWEFGTDRDPRTKADQDYSVRLASVPRSERVDCTFVFVTPRNWPGKRQWAEEKSRAGDWRAVRAIDASDLEQWLEGSISGLIWLAEKIAVPVKGFMTLDHSWTVWSAASEPQLTPDLFRPSLEAHRSTFKSWLEKQGERPFIVTADSTDEGLAFLACLFQDSEISPRWKDLAAVFDSPDILRMLAGSSSQFLPIVFTPEAERELGVIYRRLHCITVRPRNAVDSEPDIALDLLGHDAFENALAAMGIKGDAAERLERESGRSPTILRRRLSRIDAIRTPKWTREPQTASTLVPMALIGTWHVKSRADCEVVSILADRPYPEIEESVAALRQIDDPPVWSVGQYRGVASKIDVLFATNRSVTQKHLEDFFTLAEYVLSESDPALELPEDQRWAAGIYGKVRDHSGSLREGICETLVILSIHGNALFRDRLGIDVEARVALLIRRLLSPLTLDTLLSHDGDLPRYAEAAPDEFLKLLEADLQTREPVVLGLLKPASNGVFGGCPRTGLLWALECLAWKPGNLLRVSTVLAQLSRTKIDDNWVNKPIATLLSIYRSWMPQTAASLIDRIKALDSLTKRYPDIAWQICMDQLARGPRSGHYNYRPRWRSDASGAGQVVGAAEIYDFNRKALELPLAWPKHDDQTLGDLIERLETMGEEYQASVWDLVDRWASDETDDVRKAALRERIRRYAFTRRGQRRGVKAATRERARAASALLEPRDLVVRHHWLFANQWVEPSADDIEDEDFDLSKLGDVVHGLRSDALREIWTAHEFEGVLGLLARSNAPHTVGQHAVSCVTAETSLIDFLERCLAIDGDLENKADACIQGFLFSLETEIRVRLLSVLAGRVDAARIGRLFRCAPFAEETWRLLDRYGVEIRNRYWAEVTPSWGRHTDGELTELIDRLLDAHRPRAAFHAVHMDWSRIETSRLKRLLLSVATSTAEPPGILQLDPYDVSAALESLDGRPGVTPDEMAQLEFMYISALDRSEHGIPNLERRIAESPSLFVQVLALVYKRRDEGQDPPEWRIDDVDRAAAVALAAHRLLEQMHRIPGSDQAGVVSAEALATWLNDVRELCTESGRSVIGDQCIGQLLANAPADNDGAWPCTAVCDAMETIASQEIAKGFVIGVRNSRGVHWRGEGGAQERDLARKYRRWAQLRAFDYPYIGAVLERIAAAYDREAEWEDSEAEVRKRLRD
jgi:addiction module HigA family antidote